MRPLLVMFPFLAALAAAGCGGDAARRSAPVPGPSLRQCGDDLALAPDGRIWGVTLDDVEDLDPAVAALRALPRRPTVRVVFDEERPARDYVAPVRALHAVADVMGEILDSTDVARVSVGALAARTTAYLEALGDDVDVWEIGNEVNGHWLGPPAEVAEKVERVFGLVDRAGKKAALTLHGNAACLTDPELDPITWASERLSAKTRAGLAFVFVSYYEDDCGGAELDWTSTLRDVAALFPNAMVGVGECGTDDPGRKSALLARYYRMQVDAPRFVGGFFWWTFREDMVPATRPLWNELCELIAGE